MEAKLADRNDSIYSEKRRNKELLEKLRIQKTAFESLEKSYSESQESLATALQTIAEGEIPDGKSLGDGASAISVRNESIVLAKLRSIEDVLASALASNKAEAEAHVDRVVRATEEVHGELRDVVKRLHQVNVVCQKRALEPRPSKSSIVKTIKKPRSK
jgi:hypothetical protein